MQRTGGNKVSPRGRIFYGGTKVGAAHTQSVIHEAFWIENGNIRVTDCKGEAVILTIAFGIVRIVALTCGEGDDEGVVEELYAACKYFAFIGVIMRRRAYLMD